MRAVQTYIAQKATAAFSKELKTVVKIGSVEFDFFRNLHLENVYIEDQQGDSMLFAQVIDLQLKKYDGAKRKIDFYNLEYSNGFINIGHHKNMRGNNIDFLVRYFNPPRKIKRIGPPKIWTFYFANAELQNTRFHYFDDTKPAPQKGLLDENHLEFSELNGKFADFWVVDDSLHFECKKLSGRERSGLEIKRFTAICNIHNKGMDFTNMLMKLPCSILQKELHFTYPGYKYMDEFIHNALWKATLEKSKICLKELSIFSPELKENKETLLIAGAKIRGAFDSLYIQNLESSFGKSSIANGSFFFRGLPKWENTINHFEIKKIETNADDLSKLLNGYALPKTIHQMGKMGFSGNFHGQFLDFEISGNGTTSAGDFNLDLFHLNIKNGTNNAIYKGKVTSQNFNLASLSVANFGRVNGSAEIDGIGLDERNFKITTIAQIDRIEFRGNAFTSGIVNGSISANGFDGKASISGQNNAFIDFDGSVDYSNRQQMNFTSYFNNVNLFDLGIDTANTWVTGKFNVQSKGFDLKRFQGEIGIEQGKIFRHGKSFEIKRTHIQKLKFGENERVILRGDILDLYLEGNYVLSEMIPVFQNAIAGVLPERVQAIDKKRLDSFQFETHVKQPDLIADFIHPQLSITPLKLKGFIHERTGRMELNSDTNLPFSVHFKTYTVNSIQLRTRKPNYGFMRYLIKAKDFRNDDSLILQNIKIDGQMQQNFADLDLFANDRTLNNNVNLNLNAELLKDSVPITFGRSSMNVNYKRFEVQEKSHIIVFDNRIICDTIFLGQGVNSAKITGVAGAAISDVLCIQLNEFNFNNIQPFLKASQLDSFNADFSGKVFISALFKQPHLRGEIVGNNLEYKKYNYGNVTFNFKDTQNNSQLFADCRFFQGPIDSLRAMGTIAYNTIKGQNDFDIKLEIPKEKPATLKVLQPFLDGIVSIKSGDIYGSAAVYGTFDKPHSSGRLFAKKTNLMVDYLKTSYEMDGEFQLTDKGLFTTKPIRVIDETKKGNAKLSLSLTHKNFNQFYFDMRLDSARNLFCLNTTEKDNDLYFGQGYADGNVRIYGPFESINMDINLKTRKGSRLTLLYSDVSKNEVKNYIIFKNRFGSDAVTDSSLKPKKATVDAINRIKIELETTPDAQIAFVIDKVLGDSIYATGSGMLKMLYDENDNFTLNGEYKLKNGIYTFSIPYMYALHRAIELEENSTVAWSGDPYNAELNMIGKYVNKISPERLMHSISSNFANNKYPIMEFYSVMKFSGSLVEPKIEFDIDAPQLKNAGDERSNEVNVQIQRIRSLESDRVQQAISLIILKSFVPPSFAESNSALSVNTGFLSGTVSNIVSNLASQLLFKAGIFSTLEKWGIKPKLDLNFDNRQNSNPGTNINFTATFQAQIGDKISFLVGYDPLLTTGARVDLSYQQNENLKWRAFNRSSNVFTEQTNSGGNQNFQYGNTLGGSAVFQKEFDFLISRKSKSIDTTSIKLKADSTKTKKPEIQ